MLTIVEDKLLYFTLFIDIYAEHLACPAAMGPIIPNMKIFLLD
jgi:hypothetical protein